MRNMSFAAQPPQHDCCQNPINPKSRTKKIRSNLGSDLWVRMILLAYMQNLSSKLLIFVLGDKVSGNWNV